MTTQNPEILRWARETSGFSMTEAASRLRIGAARGVSPDTRLQAYESGTDTPTRATLVKMAKLYRRPLVTFYLDAPPQKGDRGTDFRTLPRDYSERSDSNLDALMRTVTARQSLVKALLAEEDADTLDYVNSATTNLGVDAVVASIRSTLGFSIEDYRRAADPGAAFGALRAAAESQGVFVLLAGDLGSHHSAISLETFRGFTIADNLAPFIVINDRDSRAAWSFTLLHELTHLWLGQTGVGGWNTEAEIEKFCNDVASDYLLPSSELDWQQFPIGAPAGSLRQAIDDFANHRNLSRTMVAYRLYRSDRIAYDAWKELTGQFHDEWVAARVRRREASRLSESRPSYYVVRKHRVGDHLIEVVDRNLSEGNLTTTKAGFVLGVKPKKVRTLIETGG